MEAKKFIIIRSVCIGGIVIFGSLCILEKSSLRIEKIYYPVFQSCLLCIGEILSILILVFRRKVLGQKTEKNLKFAELDEFRQNKFTRLGNYTFIISGFCEFISNLLETITLNILSPSSVVSLKCLIVLYVLYYRIFHINRNIFRHQKLGLTIFLLGMAMVIIAILVEKNFETELNKILGIIVMIVAEGFAAIHLITLEYFMNTFNTAPEVANGIKGLTGIFLSVCLFFPFGMIFKQYFERFGFDKPFVEMGKNPIFLGIFLGIIGSSCFFSYFVSKTLQFMEAMTVCIVQSGWIFVVWVIDLSFKKHDINYIEIVGGVLIILGLFIYNGVLVLPCFGMKKSAAEFMKQNKVYLRQKEKHRTFCNTLFVSPID